MARKYLYDVVVTLNTKGEVILERADKHEGVDGFTPDEGNLILAAMEKTAKEEKTTVEKWSYFCKVGEETKPITDRKARENRVPVVLCNQWGKPYIGMLTPQENKAPPKAKRPVIGRS